MAATEQTTGVAPEWTPRDVPLTPVAVAARGSAARQLAYRLLALDEAGLARLQGVSGADVLLILGEQEALPWAPGVVYLGRDPEAPALLLPTTHAVSVPAALLERALLAHFRQVAPPLAVLPELRQVISGNQARPVCRELLREWLREGA